MGCGRMEGGGGKKRRTKEVLGWSAPRVRMPHDPTPTPTEQPAPPPLSTAGQEWERGVK